MTEFEQWAARHPQAAGELLAVLVAECGHPTAEQHDGRESAAQHRVRLAIAKTGAMAWRNNVGATPSRCPHCKAPQSVIRYGLANDSTRLNERIKSSDLILAIPRRITPADVGKTIAQFGAIETKRPGWKYTGTPREAAQFAWLALITGLGGYAAFSTGEVNIYG